MNYYHHGHEPYPYFAKYFDEHGAPRAIYTPRVEYDGGSFTLPGYLDYLAFEKRKVQILHISDLHVPLHDPELLDLVLTRHASADLVLVGGDALEIYSLSRFTKRQNIPLEIELDQWLWLQELLSKTFPAVAIIDSNHLSRVGSALKEVPSSLSFLVESNLHKHLARPFPNVFVVPNWWTQVGDCIFAHGDVSKAKAPQAAWMVWKKLENFARVGQVPIQPGSVRCVVQAHTHRVGSSYESGVKLIESGCLARLPLEYTVTADSVKFLTPQQNGYVLVTQQGGKTILNETREHALGAAYAHSTH